MAKINLEIRSISAKCANINLHRRQISKPLIKNILPVRSAEKRHLYTMIIPTILTTDVVTKNAITRSLLRNQL